MQYLSLWLWNFQSNKAKNCRHNFNVQGNVWLSWVIRGLLIDIFIFHCWYTNTHLYRTLIISRAQIINHIIGLIQILSRKYAAETFLIRPFSLRSSRTRKLLTVLTSLSWQEKDSTSLYVYKICYSVDI